MNRYQHLLTRREACQGSRIPMADCLMYRSFGQDIERVLDNT